MTLRIILAAPLLLLLYILAWAIAMHGADLSGETCFAKPTAMEPRAHLIATKYPTEALCQQAHNTDHCFPWHPVWCSDARLLWLVLEDKE